MDEVKRSFDGAVVAQQKLCGFSEKVCYVCRLISKRDNDGEDFHGYLVFVVDLSELVDGFKGVLQPDILLEFDIGMSVCGLDFTLYFTHFALQDAEERQEVYSIYIGHRIQTHRQLDLGAADLRSLPPMLGCKSSALIASIPGTKKKILVFSSWYSVYSFDPDLAADGNDEEEEYVDPYVDFEMYDVETNSWEKLPQLVIRISFDQSWRTASYFLHQSDTDKRGTEIPRNARAEEKFNGFKISRYTFIDDDKDGDAPVFLAQLTCGVKLTLDLNSPSKGWKLYNECVVVKPPSTCSDHQNLFVVAEKDKRSWCASDIGGDSRKFGDIVSFPLSPFDKDDPVKVHTCLALTPLEGDKGKVCIVQGGVSRDSKHAQVIMDVVNYAPQAQPELVSSCRFEVVHKCKLFLPFCMFVCHPKERH